MYDILYLDIENNADDLMLVSWAINDCPVTVDTEAHADLRGHLRDPAVVKVTQSDHDLRWFKMHGYEVAGEWHDTMVMAWVLDENQPKDLGSLVARYVGGGASKTKHIRRVAGRLRFNEYDFDDFVNWPMGVLMAFKEYAENDVVTLRLLYKSLLAGLREAEFDGYWLDEEVPYSRVLLDMEVRGLPINLEANALLTDEVRRECDDAEARLREMSNLPPSFNLNSHVQLRQYLFRKWFTIPDKLPMSMDPLPSDEDFEVTKVGRLWIEGVWRCRGRGLAPTPPPKRKVGPPATEPSTGTPELLYKHGRDPFVQTLVEYRRANKLLGTYLEKFPRIAVPCPVVGKTYTVGPGVDTMDYRIFGRFNQTGTVTGRLSSSDPNLQNIPARREVGKRVRGLFQGHFIIGDYDSLEMRLLAHFSRDPALVRVFQEGGDPHALTAKGLFGVDVDHDSPERDIAKTVNYAIAYGAGPLQLAKTLSLAGFPTTQATAGDYQSSLAALYPRLARWKNNVMFQAKKSGGVSTIGGRRRRLFTAGSTWLEQAYGERQAVNTVVQGSAADILRRVMLTVDRLAQFDQFKLLAQIHDELIWEYDPTELVYQADLDALQEACETGHGFDLRVPLSFVPMVCDTWADKGTGVDLTGLTEEE